MQARLFLVVLLLTGCGRKPVPQAPNNGTPKGAPRAELRIGDNSDEPRHLPFTITAVYEQQKRSPEPPFHTPGGAWTFFDCQASGDGKVNFTVGVTSKSGPGNVPVAWGNAVLIVKDREAGARFIELFSRAFAGKLPAPVRQGHVPQPLAIKTAILGQNMDRESRGGFSGKAGKWTATKWFPEHDGRSGEVYFNYNLANRQGEFSEKDADYAGDLVALFATAFRDGPRPERTPENDPNLTRTGPRIGPPRKLLSRLSSHYAFSPNDEFAVYQDGPVIWALPIGQADAKPREVIRFDYSPWEVHVLNTDLDLLVQEGVPETPGVKSSADPMRIWWIDGKRSEKKLLRGPEKDLNLAEAPASPDHRFVALHQWRDNPGGKGRTKRLYFLDRESGKTQVVVAQAKDLSIVGWKKSGAGWRAVAVTNRWRLDPKEPSEWFLADPTTGKLERQDQADAQYDIHNRLSPDGKHRVRVGKDELIVTAVADGKQRRFVLHEDDRRLMGEECVEWVSLRYLKFNGSRLALIDVTTMKMSFPTTADGAKIGSHSCKFGSDFRWVLYQGEAGDGEALFLAPIEMPKE